MLLTQYDSLKDEQRRATEAIRQFEWFVSHDLLISQLVELRVGNSGDAEGSQGGSLPLRGFDKKRPINGSKTSLGSGEIGSNQKVRGPKVRVDSRIRGVKEKQNGITVGFMIPKKTRNLILLLLTIPALCLIRYLILTQKSEPVAFLIGSTATALRLYNYMIMGNWAVVTTVLYNNTMPINFQQSTQEFEDISDKYQSLVDKITFDLSELSQTSTHGKLYSQIYNTNVCYILAKRAIKNRFPPFCALALNQISNNTLVRFLHRYGSLWIQLMNTWASLPPENRYMDMLRNPDFLGLVASINVDYHGIPNCVYYHLLVPTMLLIDQETTSLIQTLNLSNILSVSLGTVLFVLIWLSCREIFWDERTRLANLIKSIPLGLILASSSLQSRLRNAIKEESAFSW